MVIKLNLRSLIRLSLTFRGFQFSLENTVEDKSQKTYATRGVVFQPYNSSREELSRIQKKTILISRVT